MDKPGDSDDEAAIDPTSNSAILQLQVNYLLSDERTSARALHESAEEIAPRLSKLLSALPACTLTATPEFLEKFPGTKSLKMQFEAPAKVEVTGPLLFDCLAEDSSTVYLEVELPRSCLLAKDHLSHRYHAKRALFLHHLGKKLQKSLQKRAHAAANGTSPPDATVSFVAPACDTRSPCLAFADAETDRRVVLSARPAEDAFPAAKLAPNRNNLRTVRSAAAAAAEQAAQDPGLSPTPRYNGSILADALRHGLCVELAAALPLPRQRDVARLLRLWLLAQVPRGVHAGPMLLGVLVALGMAVRAGQVTKSMSVLQAFRVVLTALSSSKPPRFTLQTGADSSAVATAAAAASCVALDATGALNVLQPVPLAAWQHAQRAAAASLAALSGPFGVAGAAAAPLLAPQRCALLACDAVLRVQLPAPPAPARLAGDAPWPAAAARRAESLLKRALSDRAHAVSVTPLPPAPVAVQRTPLLPGLEVDAELECRILLNPTEAYRILDRGPPADAVPGAAAFRKLWGARSEMRRLPDASICEAVAWDTVLPSQRLALPDMIVKHILQLHFPGAEVSGTAAAFEPALETPAAAGDAARAHRALDAAVHAVSQRLRQLQGLSLAVLATQACGPAARHTAAFPPQPHPLLLGDGAAAAAAAADVLPRCVEPCTLLVQVEGSGKWPDNEEAAGKLRSALGCQIAQALESQFGMHARAAEGHVDVHAQGFVLRLRLWSDRDDALAERTAQGLKLRQEVRKVMVSGRGAAMLRQRLLLRHHGLMAALAGEHPAAPHACRLVKRWAAGQMLSWHLPEEMLELLVAAAFSSKLHGRGPASAAAAFCRVLHLLATHEWAAHPLPADPAAALPPAAAEAAVKAHRVAVAAGTAAAAVMPTPYDPDGTAWTRSRPDAAMLMRARRLAAASLDAAAALLAPAPVGSLEEAQASDSDSDTVKDGCVKVFGCDLRAYDALVVLKDEALPRAGQQLQPSALQVWIGTAEAETAQPCSDLGLEADESSKRSRAIVSHIPRKAARTVPHDVLADDLLVGIDPVAKLCEDIESRFGHCAVVNADEWGGKAIGIKWRPQAFDPGPFRVAIAHTLELVCKS